jgi:glycerophosphoryl diester phosphodiesterase
VEAQRARRAALLGEATPARIGIYPETKHPSHFAARGLAMETTLLATLARFGYAGAAAPVWLQSFEVGNLIQLAAGIDGFFTDQPDIGVARPDRPRCGGSCSYADLVTPQGTRRHRALRAGDRPCQGAHPRAAGRHGGGTGLVAAARAWTTGPWTFRASRFPRRVSRGTDPARTRGPSGRIRYLAAGIDG